MRPSEPGMVFAALGRGWGKSAMAHGYVARGFGLGWTSVIVQFVKGSDWHPRITEFAHRLGVETFVVGSGMTWASTGPTPGHKDPTSRAQSAWRFARDKLLDDTTDLVVLDELGLALAYGWLDVDMVTEDLGRRDPRTHVIITATDLPEAVMNVADAVTTFERTLDPLGRPIS